MLALTNKTSLAEEITYPHLISYQVKIIDVSVIIDNKHETTLCMKQIKVAADRLKYLATKKINGDDRLHKGAVLEKLAFPSKRLFMYHNDR